MKCIKGITIRPLKSQAGWYIGSTIFDDEMRRIVPNCRVSVDYFKTEAEAEKAITEGFEQRSCIENNFCSGGRGCCLSRGKSAPQLTGGMMVKKMIEQYEKGR